MKIYVIHNEETCKRVKPILSKYGEVVCLTKELGDISKYTEIFEDKEEKVLAAFSNAINWSLPNEALAKIKNLRGISLTSSWYKFLDLEFCKTNNIKVTSTTGANANSVAEYAIWMMFSLARNLPLQIREGYKKIIDENHQVVELEGKTVGIIGLGIIGTLIANKCAGLGLNVIYWSRNKKGVPYKFASMEDVMSESDVIFNCLELCEGTKGIITHELLDLMKKTAYYVCIFGGAGWGPADDNYIVNMVKAGKLAGMAIENEDAKDYKFEECSDCNVFRPGTYAWYTKEALQRIDKAWIDGIIGIITSEDKHRVV